MHKVLTGVRAVFQSHIIVAQSFHKKIENTYNKHKGECYEEKTYLILSHK